MALNSDFQKLYVDGLIQLFELDASALGAGILRFHGHIAYRDWEKIYLTVDNTNISIDSEQITADQTALMSRTFGPLTIDNTWISIDKNNYSIDQDQHVTQQENVTTGELAWYRDIVWQGETFEPIALQCDGLEMRSDGKASAPTLTLANNFRGVQGAISAYCLQFKDFVGMKLKVITTLAKYLDAENFTTGNSSAQNEAKEQLWYIEQKTSENAQAVTFELSNPIDFEGLKIPVRQISNYCQWEYRSEECGYTGAELFTHKDEPTDRLLLDQCSKRLSGCECRFKKGNVLRFGGFPASSLL